MLIGADVGCPEIPDKNPPTNPGRTLRFPQGSVLRDLAPPTALGTWKLSADTTQTEGHTLQISQPSRRRNVAIAACPSASIYITRNSSRQTAATLQPTEEPRGRLMDRCDWRDLRCLTNCAPQCLVSPARQFLSVSPSDKMLFHAAKHSTSLSNSWSFVRALDSLTKQKLPVEIRLPVKRIDPVPSF